MDPKGWEMVRLVRIAALGAVTSAMGAAPPVQAQEVFVGVAAHAVDTPFTFDTQEGGADLQLGYRGAPIEALDFLGSPEPYVFGSLNTRGDTSFAAAGLA